MMSKMLCVSSCSTVSDCVFRILQVTACSATYIIQLGRSIQVLLKMSSLYMIVIQPMQQTLLVKFGGIGGEKYKKTRHFSPDLCPYDHDLNHKLKQLLHGKLFANREDILVAMWCKIALFKMSGDGDGVLPFKFFSLNHGHLQGLF